MFAYARLGFTWAAGLSARWRLARLPAAASRASMPRPRPSWPGCVGRASSARTRPVRASTAGAAGTGGCRTTGGGSTRAAAAGARAARVGGADEPGGRVDGRGCWNWVFQNDEVVIHVVCRSRGAGVVAEVMAGHRPAIWVSDRYGAQRGHAAAWPICLAPPLPACPHAARSGDTVFAPRLKATRLLRARGRGPGDRGH